MVSLSINAKRACKLISADRHWQEAVKAGVWPYFGSESYSWLFTMMLRCPLLKDGGQRAVTLTYAVSCRSSTQRLYLQCE